MKLKEERKLTQKAVDEILSDVTELCTDIVSDLRECITTELQSHDMSIDDLPRLKDIFDESFCYSRPFKGLETAYLQLSFYKDHFQMIVSYTLMLNSCNT